MRGLGVPPPSPEGRLHVSMESSVRKICIFSRLSVSRLLHTVGQAPALPLAVGSNCGLRSGVILPARPPCPRDLPHLRVRLSTSLLSGATGRWAPPVFPSPESSHFSGVLVAVLESGVGSHTRVGERPVLRGVAAAVPLGRQG